MSAIWIVVLVVLTTAAGPIMAGSAAALIKLLTAPIAGHKRRGLDF